MDPIPSGSRGAVRLDVQGTRSNDGAGTIFVASQRWSFQKQRSARIPNFSEARFQLESGSSSLVALTPPTVPLASDTHSLYPRSHSGAGSSVDADIILAQRFLREQHPDVEIPDFVLSNIIYENAAALEDTAHTPDGSLGLADSQAVAVLGPVASQQKRIYAIVCIGGRNRDCLLLHQLHVQAAINEVSAASASGTESRTSGKGKAKAADPPKMTFIPAHGFERKYKTPILQLSASPDRGSLAVRTHSSTSFLSLSSEAEERTLPWLRLDTTYQLRYGIGACSQHVDVCFGSRESSIAASVDRMGNIDVFKFSKNGLHEQQLQPPDMTPESPAPGSPSDSPSDPKSTARRGFTPALLAGSNLHPTKPSVSVQRIPAELLLPSTTDMERGTPAVASSDAENTTSQQSAGNGWYRITFASSDRSLYLMPRHSLVHVALADPEPAAETEGVPQISTILRSGFCLTSFRRERFFSIASSTSKAGSSLMAMCSSDSIYWFDQSSPSKPLFATAHHRGDDPTLTLTTLPELNSNLAAKDGLVSMWALSSLHNDLVSCFSIRSYRREGPGQDLLHGDPGGHSDPVDWCHVLEEAPSLLPIASSQSKRRRVAAPPAFFDAAELQSHHSRPWIVFELTERGALLARLLQASLAPTSQIPPPSNSDLTLEMHVERPPSNISLYLKQLENPLTFGGHVDSLSDVKTRILDLETLHGRVFSAYGKRVAETHDDGIIRNEISTAEHLADLTSAQQKGRGSIHAATLSLGQLFREFNRSAQPDRMGPVCSWLRALNADSDDETSERTAKLILDFRADVRHALSSLGVSSAQGGWFRTADLVSNRHGADLGTGQNGRMRSPERNHVDILERVLTRSKDQTLVASYLPVGDAVHDWEPSARRSIQESLKKASRRMMLDLALETEIFIRPKARILDEGAPTQRPLQRRGTNWTAFEHRDIYNFVEEQGDTIPPPHIGSVGLSFFVPLRSGDTKAATGLGKASNGMKKGLAEAELEALLPSTSSTARLLLAEWQLGEDPTEYTYLDPFEGLHRLPRASRLRGPTARARSRSFSRASSASTEDRSRSRSRSRKSSAAPSFSQPDFYGSQGPSSSYPPSLVSQSQPAALSAAPPTLASRRKRQHNEIVSRSQPIRAPLDGWDRGRPAMAQPSIAAQSQPAAPPRFGFAGSFGDVTPTISPASSQVGTPTQSRFGASTQIEAGRFGARPVKNERPPKKKKRASGF